MIIDIHYLQIKASESLSAIITHNLRKLAHKYQSLIRADVRLKLEGDPSGRAKVCEIRLRAPGPKLFAKTNEDNFEKAAFKALDQLEKQLRKRKQKYYRRKKSLLT